MLGGTETTVTPAVPLMEFKDVPQYDPDKETYETWRTRFECFMDLLQIQGLVRKKEGFICAIWNSSAFKQLSIWMAPDLITSPHISCVILIKQLDLLYGHATNYEKEREAFENAHQGGLEALQEFALRLTEMVPLCKYEPEDFPGILTDQFAKGVKNVCTRRELYNLPHDMYLSEMLQVAVSLESPNSLPHCLKEQLKVDYADDD